MAITADVARGVVLDDRYRLEKVIGQGGMATVYRSHDLVLGRDVAIKLFPPVAEDADDLLRHQAEMRVLAQMSHPGLVTLHDAGSAYVGGPMQQTYLVMELVTGPTLAERLARGPLTPTQTALLGRQLAEALAEVHTSDVVHRDVKPANILLVDPAGLDSERGSAVVSTGPIVKLADFGIARLSDGARLTMTGTTLGTATYLSPEQAMGGAVGPATEVYALGLVLLECLTGRKAFTGTIVEVAAARLNTAPPIPDDLDQDWSELLEGMTRRQPQDRVTAAEVAMALTTILHGGSPVVVRRDADDEAAPRRRRTLGARAVTAPPSESLGAAGPPEPDDGDGTRRFSTEELRAHAGPNAGPGAVRPGAGPERAVASPRRPFGVALAAVAAVVLAAVVFFASQAVQDTAEAASDPVYPQVEGIMGDALEALQESVEP